MPTPRGAICLGGNDDVPHEKQSGEDQDRGDDNGEVHYAALSCTVSGAALSARLSRNALAAPRVGTPLFSHRQMVETSTRAWLASSARLILSRFRSSFMSNSDAIRSLLCETHRPCQWFFHMARCHCGI